MSDTLQGKGSITWARPEFAALWPVVAGIVGVWVYAVPAVFNKSAKDFLSEANPAVWIATELPVLRVTEDAQAVYYCALAAIGVALMAAPPSIPTRRLVKSTFVVLCATTGFTAITGFTRLVPDVCIMTMLPWIWYVLLVGAVFLGIWSTLDTKKSPWLSQPFQKHKRLFVYLSVIMSLVNAYYLIPHACGKWWAAATARNWDEKPNWLVRLAMHDTSSPIHNEWVEVLFMTPKFIVVEPSDQIPRPEIRQGVLGDAPGLPFRFYETRVSTTPMVVALADIQAMSPSLSPSAKEHWQRRYLAGKFPGQEFEFRTIRIPGGGFKVIHEAASPEAASQPTRQISGRVAGFVTPYALILDVGRNSGVEKGMRFDILGEIDVTDPDDPDRQLGPITWPKTTVEATFVDDDIAFARLPEPLAPELARTRESWNLNIDAALVKEWEDRMTIQIGDTAVLADE